MLQFSIYSIQNQNQKVLKLDTISLKGHRIIQDCICYAEDGLFNFLCLDFESSLLKVSYNFNTRNHQVAVFKIRSRGLHPQFISCIWGQKYVINDVLCPSFIVFTSSSSELLLGIITEDSIKFWNLNCDLARVESAIFSEELNLFFMSSSDKSGYFSIDFRNLKFVPLKFVESYAPFVGCQPSNVCLGSKAESLFCISQDKKCIYSVVNGKFLKSFYFSDAIFKGFTKIWCLKKHFLDANHAFILLSSPLTTTFLNIEDFLVSDITNLLGGIEQFGEILWAFNVHSTSYLIIVFTSKIIVLDLSKMDSITENLLKFDLSSTNNIKWNLSCSTRSHLICLSNSSRCLEIFSLKNRPRPRDNDMIAKISEVKFLDLDIFDEITAITVHSTESECLLALGSVSGVMYCIIFDSNVCLKSVKSVNINVVANSISFSDKNSELCLVIGTRSGHLVHWNFNTPFSSAVFTNTISTSPVTLTNYSNSCLLAYSNDSAILQQSHAIGDELVDLKILNWSYDIAAEFIHTPEDPWILGIKDDSLLVTVLNSSSSASPFSSVKLLDGTNISSFLSLNSNQHWLIGYNEGYSKKNSVGMFNGCGTLIASIDQGFDEPIHLFCVCEEEFVFMAVLTTKDRLNSKLHIITFQDDKLEISHEYICAGLISNAKYSN